MIHEEFTRETGIGLQSKIAELLSRFRFRRNTVPQSGPAMYNLLAANPQPAHGMHGDTVQWLTNVIRAKLNNLSEKFLNTNIQFHENLSTLSVEFSPCTDFPIPANFYVELRYDTNRNMLCASTVYIIFPSNLMYENNWRELEISPVAPDSIKLEEFLDEAILDFVENYLRAHEHDSPYLKETRVMDPVCELRMQKSSAAETLNYHDKVLYFCSPECKQRFLLAPKMYTERLSSK